jgi:hypothetical protein
MESALTIHTFSGISDALNSQYVKSRDIIKPMTKRRLKISASVVWWVTRHIISYYPLFPPSRCIMADIVGSENKNVHTFFTRYNV